MFTLTARTTPTAFVADMRRPFEWFFGPGPFEGLLSDRATAAPQFWAHRDDEGLTVQADLPGVTLQDLEVKVESGQVLVSGKRTLDLPEGYRALRQERMGGRFKRQFRLPDDVNADAAEAKLTDGVLTLSFPLRPDKQPKRLEIKVS